MEVKAICADLEAIYKPLIGMTFIGTYSKTFEPMPQTGNARDILLIGRQNPFATTLHGISTAVLAKCGTVLKVWKGITGPEDGYTDYWLWVEPDFSGVLNLGSAYEFKVEKCGVFQCPSGSFSYGISTKVSLIREVTA